MTCSFDELVEQSDAISIHVPYCPETHHMFNRETFSRMKDTAVIVCTARGNIVDEAALYTALKEGKIAAAGLDVYASEPLSADSPLIGLDNIILTPHVSSQTVESLWAKNGPKKSTFKFGVGGTDENYKNYWGTASAFARAHPAKKENDKEKE